MTGNLLADFVMCLGISLKLFDFGVKILFVIFALKAIKAFNIYIKNNQS